MIRTKFIDKIVILFVIIMILLLGMNLFYTEIVMKNKDVYRKHAEFLEYKQTHNITIVALGDSIATDDFNPIYINNSFNLATPGEELRQTYYKAKWLIKNEPQIDTYIIEYNRHLFNYYRIGSYYDQKYWKNYMTYEELSKETNISKYNLYITVNIPVIGKGEEIWRYYTDRRKPAKIENGWFNYTDTFPDLQGNNMESNGRTRSLSQFKKYPIVMEQDLLKQYFETLLLLKTKNKKIVLVVYPMVDEYLKPLEEKINITKEFEEVDEAYKELNEMFTGPNITILDYREMLRYNKTLFVHSDHLNRDGAEIFTKQLAEDLLSNVH